MPVVDGSFIVERPTVTLARGDVNGVTVLHAFNSHISIHLTSRLVHQEFALSITNAFEGESFVNASQPETGNTTLYISELFPFLGQAQIEQGVALYAQTGGTSLDQVIGIMGECA